MGLKNKNVFIRKVNPKMVYRWSPMDANQKVIKSKGKIKGESCIAIPNSQGYDNKTGYVYKIINDNHNAYMECDYVK